MRTIDHMYFATALVLDQPIVVFKEYNQEGMVEAYGATTAEVLH